jgi:hypothetical protein
VKSSTGVQRSRGEEFRASVSSWLHYGLFALLSFSASSSSLSSHQHHTLSHYHTLSHTLYLATSASLSLSRSRCLLPHLRSLVFVLFFCCCALCVIFVACVCLVAELFPSQHPLVVQASGFIVSSISETISWQPPPPPPPVIAIVVVVVVIVVACRASHA